MASQLYLRISGIDGPVLTPPAYAKSIKVLSFSWGTDSFGSTSGSGGARKFRMDEIFITKESDKTSGVLYRKCANGDHITKVQLDVTTLKGKVVTKFMEFVFKDVLISSFGMDREGLESVTFNFAEMSTKYENASGNF